MKQIIINTLADKNYAHYVAALIDSINEQYATDLEYEYKICVWTLDRTAYEKVGRCVDSKIPLIVKSVDELRNQKDFKRLENNPPSFEAINVGKQKNIDPKYMEFLWALASYSTFYTLQKYQPDGIIYVDADCYFLNTWTKVVPTLMRKSIGLVRNNAPDENNGRYNVSFIWFKNDLVGNKALMSWRGWLLDKDNQYAKEYGTVGDQKYLDLFEPLFGKENICDLDEEGITQLAPWSVGRGDLDKSLFYHFSDFRPSYDVGIYWAAPRHGFSAVSDKFDGALRRKLEMLYKRYFEHTEKYYTLYNSAMKEEK